MLQFLLTLTEESNHSKIEYIYYNFHDDMMRFAINKFQLAQRSNFGLDAEDAVQSAFLRITKYINNIDFSKSKQDIKNYVFTILLNEILKILNDNSENIEFFEEFYEEKRYNYIEELQMKEQYALVVKTIEHMDEKYSSTLYLVFVEEKTPLSVAEEMGISVKTVYTRLSRGKQLLIDSIKGEKDGENK